MNIEVKVPMFAEGATKIKIRQWLVEKDENVNKGDILIEATTDKIAIYIEAPESGTLISKLADENDEVQVGQVVAVLSRQSKEA